MAGANSEDLINTTYDAMMNAINILQPGKKLGDIGHEIQNFVEKKLNTTLFCRETLKYGTFCRKIFKYALLAEKMA